MCLLFRVASAALHSRTSTTALATPKQTVGLLAESSYGGKWVSKPSKRDMPLHAVDRPAVGHPDSRSPASVKCTLPPHPGSVPAAKPGRQAGFGVNPKTLMHASWVRLTALGSAARRRHAGSQAGGQSVPYAHQPDPAPRAAAALGLAPHRALPGGRAAALWHHLCGALLCHDVHLAGAPMRLESDMQECARMKLGGVSTLPCTSCGGTAAHAASL